MKIGDKVRFIHSKDQGIIKKIVNENTFEVEIEDGFRIPVQKNEIVVVASDEYQKFTKPAYTNEPVSEDKQENELGQVYIAFHPFNDNIYSLYLINDSAFQLLFTIHEKFNEEIKGISLGVLGAKKTEKIGEYKFKEFEKWPEIIIQTLFYKNGKTRLKSATERKFKFTASGFYKSKKIAPLLGKEAFVYSLDNSSKLNPAFLLENLLGSDTPQIINVNKPDEEIDLHIDKLLRDYKSMNNGEILEYQVSFFEKKLEDAFAHNLSQIIFIHGSGNGTLKNRIHKKLSQNKNIKFFEEARKDKFGYGATLVRLK